MDYNTDILVIIENGKEKKEHIFKNEVVKITRASKLLIRNDRKDESNFYENIRLWNGIDQDTNSKSYYTIKTGNLTPIEEFRKYYVSKIDELDQCITFKWLDN